MEVNVEQNALFPSSKSASTLDGQRSELMLPQVSTLDNENLQNYVLSWDKCLVMSEKNEGDSLSSTKNNSIFEENNSDPHFSQGYNSGYTIKAKQHQASNDGVVFKGSRNINMDLFYISQGDQIKAYNGSRLGDQVSDENKSSFTNNRVHKAPVARQDSAAFDFTLGSPNETMHSSILEIKRHVGNGQAEELNGTCNKNNLTQARHGLQEESPVLSDHQRQNLTKQTLPKYVAVTPYIEHGKMIGKNQFFSKAFADSEWRFPGKSTQEMWNYVGSEQLNSQIQPDKKNVKSFPFSNTDNSNKAKRSESTKQNYKLDKDNNTMWNQVLQFAKLCLGIVVMVMLVHLQMRVSVLESHGVSSATMRCQCDKTQEGPFMDKTNGANGEIADLNYEHTHQQIMTYFDNENSKASTDGDTAKSFLHPDGDENIQANQKYPVFKAGQMEHRRVGSMQTKNPSVERHTKTKSVKTNASNEGLNLSGKGNADLRFSTNKNNHKEVNATHDFSGSSFRAVKTFPIIDDIQEADVPVVTMDTTGHEVSRHKRHAGRKENDPGFRAKLPKKSKNETRNNGPQVESFDIPYWSELFDYKKHFRSQDPSSKHVDCTTKHDWGHGIEACKDNRVIFPLRHSILPFYRATSTTANKDVKKRMIHIDPSGRFHVKISGEYLFQQNITILSDSERHFLALYVNGQATLACQNGGFVCPHTNEEGSRRYKVCVIIGVLELMKDDIVDVRTMESHMTIRAEIDKQKKSLIKFILLNKIK